MDQEEYINHIRRLIEKASNRQAILGAYAEICEFLRTYDGPESQFLAAVKELNPNECGQDFAAEYLPGILRSYLEYVEAGLLQEVSPERRAQLDVVSDFLEQAHSLLESKSVHPAAPAMIIGAALEEFLRTWVENTNTIMSGKKPSMDSYAKALLESNLITKQDMKDITSWAGLRNHAAHGEWDEVADKSRIALMLEAVNLFMRKYGA